MFSGEVAVVGLYRSVGSDRGGCKVAVAEGRS